ncbi:hypothetical protein F7725_004546 [Dissostichus mawsoni]|uniref:Breakpoint cluster region protein n=1 Tax=Dissostichus mawsoni TaxID=36200 RepID=A0A7J5XJ11_DISMA|nr:hypothetical protein F7725_004546 [Dissostichus mawsoni]
MLRLHRDEETSDGRLPGGCGISQVTASVVQMETEVMEEDVFQEEADSCPLSPLHPGSVDFPDTPTLSSPEEMLERRLMVLKVILESEEVYLRELEALLMPMKALRASAGTSKPVLSSQQVQTVFYQVPEIRDMHQSFFSGLKERLSAHCRSDPGLGEDEQMSYTGFELVVGDLFLKMSMMSNIGSDKTRTKYTFEALLYKPLDRVTKTTLVLLDILKTTPETHQDFALLQEVLRLSRSFLSGVNESSQSKRGVTLSHGMRRKLMRDGFVVDASEGERHMRHLFLYTDLLLFGWFLPLAGLKLRWIADQHHSPDAQLRLHTIRTKMHLLRQQLRQHAGSKGLAYAARSRKKLEQVELMLLTHSPVYTGAAQPQRQVILSSSPRCMSLKNGGKPFTKSLQTRPSPPDLLTLTSACVKLRMTQQPPLHSTNAVEDEMSLCGTLSVAVHSACGLQQPASVYVCVEVDGYEFYDKQATTHSSIHSLNPHWDQELEFQVDAAQELRLLCVSQADGKNDTVLGKTSVKLDSKTLNERWRRQTLHLGQVDVTVSLKFSPHPLEPPSATAPLHPVFCVPIEIVTQQEGVMVPHVVRCCAEEVERRGLAEVGIYRISGSSSDINTLKTVFNSNLRDAVTRLRRAEVNVVSGVLKLYFRELPEPLIPADKFQSLARSLEIQDVDSRLVSMFSVLHSCPAPNRNTFLFVLHHLQRVSEKQDTNKMTLMNLATIFGPSLLRLPVAALGHIGSSMDISVEVVLQVQVVFCYLQCNNLPEAQTSLPHDTDSEDETTQI